jgi:hypothetical protein
MKKGPGAMVGRAGAWDLEPGVVELGRLILQVEAEGGFRADGLLLDGEIVLTEVRSFVEELAELQADAEVFAEHVRWA